MLVTIILLLICICGIFLDWYLLTKSRFYQHYYPETDGCESFTHTGFNTKQQFLKLIVIFPVLAAIIALILSRFE